MISPSRSLNGSEEGLTDMWPAFSVRTPNCLSTNGLVQVIRSVTAFPSTFDRPIFAGSRFADFGNRQR